VTARRGTSNGNSSGSAEDRRHRRAWLLETYRADVDALSDQLLPGACGLGEGVPACRCYRCGKLLTLVTLTVDRIVPGCRGGTYRRTNVRPACSDCNSETGGAERSASWDRAQRARRTRKLVS
jgi:5-methylcytosine-specific restriction endonuclease McrA